MRAERGVVGGVEVLPFALLLVVGVTLLVLDAWAVVDAKLAATTAAREGARAEVEADAPATGPATGHRVALSVYLAMRGRAPHVAVTSSGPGTGRCGVVTYQVRDRVPTVRLPFVAAFGPAVTVVGRHREPVDRFADGRTGAATCAG